MPETVTPERLAERICHHLNLPPADHAESIASLIRADLTARFETGVAATKATCLAIAEEEAERCRRAGAYPAEQIAMTIAARIRMRHIGS